MNNVYKKLDKKTHLIYNDLQANGRSLFRKGGTKIKKPNKKVEIINAVTKLFSQKGYMISMSEIAKEAGIAVASIYTHFEGKDEVIYLSIEEEINEYYDYLDRTIGAMEGKNTEETLWELTEAILNKLNTKEKMRFWYNMFLINGEELYEKSLKIYDFRTYSFINNLRPIFESGMRNKEIDVLSVDHALYLYLSLIEGIFKGILLRGESSKKYVIQLWEAFWDGIKNKTYTKNLICD